MRTFRSIGVSPAVSSRRLRRWLPIVIVVPLAVACSKRDASPPSGESATATAAAGTSASASTASASTAPASRSDSIVRGTIAQVGDTMLTLTVTGGEMHVAITPPVQVFAREPADLAHVTANSFVGVTSVTMPDGIQRATEIHIFPEALRGLGEGSRPMGQPNGASASGGTPSTMTNGTVSSTMTNGTVAAPRMTNGAVQSQSGGTLDVAYGGGSQKITVPTGVTVTTIAPTTQALTVGANVVVLARKRADGTLAASQVLLAAPAPHR